MPGKTHSRPHRRCSKSTVIVASLGQNVDAHFARQLSEAIVIAEVEGDILVRISMACPIRLVAGRHNIEAHIARSQNEGNLRILGAQHEELPRLKTFAHRCVPYPAHKPHIAWQSRRRSAQYPI